ncbi:hypothetical protein UFOVP84_129 [uncultured Caudovirales phage]|uniref:Uncharacterized protein n=1 Tax=uncultured Caudovirales phage TaxID=2100421 RepID=A0A6J5L159_9CAUD|nr:hypothetical protein UFOVP84_129 [uncultured Caudovirales phage]
MLTFKSVLTESASISQEYVKSLIQAVYSGQLVVTGSTSITVKVDDRSEVKSNLYNLLDHNKIPYKDIDVAGSSFKGTQINHNGKIIKITFKNTKAGGSGAGSAITNLGESAQCWYTAVAFNGYDLKTADDFYNCTKHIKSKCFTTADYNAIKSLPDDWIKSSIKIANHMKTMSIFKTKMANYDFHRGSNMVVKISKMYASANKADKRFSDINKWTPADIWVATKAGELAINNASNTQDWVSLNQLILSLYESKDLIGVSLKKAETNVHHEVFNYGVNENLAKFNSMKISSKSKDGYLLFAYKDDPNMSIQFRSFDKVSGWQGEIKGKYASGGKIGGGNIAAIMKRVAGITLSSADAKSIATKVKAGNTSIDQSILGFAKQLNIGVNTPSEQEPDWKYSKFLTLEFLAAFSKLTPANQSIAIKEIVGYAASATDTSAVFIKIS